MRSPKVLQTFDRNGTIVGPSLEGFFDSLRLSPDQKTVAVSVREASANADVWTIDLARGIPSRVTSDSENDYFPAWTHDGRHLLFASTRTPSRAGANPIYRATVGGSGADELLDPAARINGFPNDVSSDGQFMLYAFLTKRGYDLFGVPLTSGATPVEFLSTQFNEVQARFSPDRRWVAYASDESGRFEVYVRAWPSAADRTPVSISGGMQPEWRRDGRELFYLSADRRLMAVPIAPGASAFIAGTPQALFSVDTAGPVGPYPNDYAVTADGQRFVVAVNARAPAPQTLTVFYNWTTAVQK